VSQEGAELFRKRDEFLEIFRKGEEFSKALLKENERLRYQMVALEEENRGLRNSRARNGEEEAKLQELMGRLKELETEKSQILEHFREIEVENLNFATRYVEIEEENNNLANLYVASYQLHSTLDFNEVLQIVLEIIINLIGAETFAIMLIDEKSNELVAVATEGIERESVPKAHLGEGILGKAAKEGDSFFAKDFSGEGSVDAPLIAVPLKIKEHVIGVLVIFKLLIQKQELKAIDYELFNLLAGHAATAIFSSRLYSESERKLSTIQGFLDLLTK
jgi:nitrate/nitrite-specific signal transduction histidine kinase